MTRGRYAPSPTGDLHLGNLRTAVLAWLFAHTTELPGVTAEPNAAEPAAGRAIPDPGRIAQRGDGPEIREPVAGHELLYRVEDLDASRVRPGIAERQRSDLESLGLTFDPPVIVQSTRTDAYAQALDRVGEQTFPCFCTRREIAEAASAPHVPPGRYPGTCRTLSSAQRAERELTRTPALRLRAEPEAVTVLDLLHGPVTGVPDDIVLRRNDGVAAYNLAVVVDDAASGVDQVVRGDDLLESAISQAYLARLLGYPVPTYAHVPLAVNAAGRRLAKRDGAVTLADLADRGVTAPQVLTMIAASLRLAADDEPVTLDLLLQRFSPTQVGRDPWVVRPTPG